jgi:hypothetical protein
VPIRDPPLDQVRAEEPGRPRHDEAHASSPTAARPME